MKTHHVPLIIQAIQWIFVKKKTPGKALELLFKTYEVNKFDRKIVAENVYEIIRWWRLLIEVNSANPSMQDANIARIIGINLVRKGNKLPPHDWMKNLNVNTVAKKLEEKIQIPACKHSLPDWLEEKGKNELGENWDSVMDALNSHYKQCLRVNTLKTNIVEVAADFDEHEMEFSTSGLSDDAIILDEFEEIFRHPFFKQGKIEIQDVGSQHVAYFSEVKPGMRVIDACAGAGGKTLHLAAKMKNKGKIIALDIQPYKLEELKTRCKRAGVENVEAKFLENNKVVKRLKDTADLVLIDAPCSGLGVLKRNPDIKWKLHKEELEEIITIQKDILQRYSTMVKKGGKLVYVTCSVFPSENEMRIKDFIELNQEFELEEEKNISPAIPESDGFYMARLKRKD
jgi:16S rRNA (cytosine967-C5)-methyltransferase